MAEKWIYAFGGGLTEGSAQMRELLGGKGANLAEMANLDIPVPPGFTLTTASCVEYLKSNEFPDGLLYEKNHFWVNKLVSDFCA